MIQCILFCMLLISSAIITPSYSNEEKKVVGYYAGWSIYRTPSFKPQDIDGSLVTHINYAFVKVDTKGNLILFDPWADVEYRNDWTTEKPFWGNFRQLIDLKAKYPHLKTLFSVGGWTLSDAFSELAADREARKNFATQAVAFANQYGFDGIDIDWEYPGFAEHQGSPIDKENFTLLLKELYQAAKANNPPLLVTIAGPAAPVHMENMELNSIHNYLDWINVMTYDFHGAWASDPVTNHNAPLYPTVIGDPNWNVDSAVSYYLEQGVPAEKLVLGLPFYGRSFGGVANSADGLFVSYQGAGQGSLPGEPGMRFFYDIKANLEPVYSYHWDAVSQVPYLYSSDKKEFISYDNEDSIAIKSDYIKERGLGGAMIWELGLDVRPQWTLLKTVQNLLK